MNETQRNQLDALNQKVVDGEELNELQRQLRRELSELQQGKCQTFTDDFLYTHMLMNMYCFLLLIRHSQALRTGCEGR